MYTCSQCNKKVRAEKRACFQRLPKILAFNTMRYTFNMVTMLKEKVNTHFSFPFQLDMQPYMEHNLIPKDKEEMSNEKQKEETIVNPSYDYELIGVTVHTGTADGGHYYAFIRDRYNIFLSRLRKTRTKGLVFSQNVTNNLVFLLKVTAAKVTSV